MTFLSSSQLHRSCNSGFRWATGDLRPLELHAIPDSEVDDTSTGESRPLSGSEGLTRVQSMPTGSGVEATDEAEVSTNFSEKRKRSLEGYIKPIRGCLSLLHLYVSKKC